MYNSQWVKEHFDKLGKDEALRLFKNPEEEMKFEIHAHYLRQQIGPGDSVLEIGAGPGVFTQVLHEIGARITVMDISENQIQANMDFCKANQLERSVEAWHIADICDLSRFESEKFDHIVAYGGPLSYVFEKAAVALQECHRVLKKNGTLFTSVMSLWGAINTGILGVLKYPLAVNLKIIETGNLTAENLPGHNHFCKLYSSDELISLLECNGFKDNQVIGASFLTTKLNEKLNEVRRNEAKWDELIKLELKATAARGGRDSSTHIISLSKKSG